MSRVRHGWRVPASLVLILSLLPASQWGQTPLGLTQRGLTPSGFTLRNEQDEAKTSGLEETLRATGLEETPKAHISKTLMALEQFFASLADEVLSNKDGLPKVPTGFSRTVKDLLPSYRQHGLDLSAGDVTELLTGHRRAPPQRLELEQATLLAWADLVVTELGNRFLEGRSVGDVDGILSAVRNAAKAFTGDDVKLGSMIWARYAVSPSDASLRGLIQRLQAKFHLTAGLEDGVALPLDEASRTLETYRRAEGVNAVQVGPSGPVRRLFTQADNTLTPMSGDERTKLLREVAVQNRVVLQPRENQPLLVRAPTPAELQKAGVTTGLEENDQAAARAAAQAIEMAELWTRTRAAVPAPKLVDGWHGALLFQAVPRTNLDLFHYVPLAVTAGIPVIVVAPGEIATSADEVPPLSAAGRALKNLLDTLPESEGLYHVVTTPREAAQIIAQHYDAREVKEINGVADLLQLFGLPLDAIFPNAIETVVALTRQYLAARAGLESGA